MELNKCASKEVRTINFSCKFLTIKKHYSLTQRILFLKQLHLILSSGIPIIKGMAMLEQRLDKQTASVCKRLLFDLKTGKNLAQAMRKHPKFFPNLIVILIEAGEQTGELHTVVFSLIQYYTKQKEFQGYFVKAIIYPVFLLISAFGVLLFFFLYVLPILGAAYTAMQAKPNTLLVTILQISNFLKLYYLPIIIVVFGICYALYKTAPYLTRLMLKIPWCKKCYCLFMEIRFCKLLALLLNSGINITDAVFIASSSITDVSMLPKLQLLKNYLQKGFEISTAIEHSLRLFSPLTQELLSLGASTGYLPQMLEEAAKFAEEDLQERLDKIRELCAPTLLLVAAGITATIVCAVMGPLFDLFTAIPEY